MAAFNCRLGTTGRSPRLSSRPTEESGKDDRFVMSSLPALAPDVVLAASPWPTHASSSPLPAPQAHHKPYSPYPASPSPRGLTPVALPPQTLSPTLNSTSPRVQTLDNAYTRKALLPFSPSPSPRGLAPDAAPRYPWGASTATPPSARHPPVLSAAMSRNQRLETTEDAALFFGARTASVHDSIFSRPGHGEAGRLSVGASATPRVKPAVLRQAGLRAHERRRIRGKWCQFHADNLYTVVASVAYDAGKHQFYGGGDGDLERAEITEVEDGVLGGVVVDLGVRVTRDPVPYAINVWIGGEGAIGQVSLRCLREGGVGVFAAVVKTKGGVNARDVTNTGVPATMLFWAAPTGAGERCQTVMEVDVDGAMTQITLQMVGVAAEFEVDVTTVEDGGEGEVVCGEGGHTSVTFSPGLAYDERVVTVRNTTEDDAPLLLSMMMDDSAGGAFSLVHHVVDVFGPSVSSDPESFDEETVVLLRGGESLSFTAVFDGEAVEEDGVVVDKCSPSVAGDVSPPMTPVTPSKANVLGLAKIAVPAWIPGARTRAVDKELLQYFDHMIDFVRPPAEMFRRNKDEADDEEEEENEEEDEEEDEEVVEEGELALEDGEMSSIYGAREEGEQYGDDDRSILSAQADGECADEKGSILARIGPAEEQTETRGTYDADYDDHDNDMCRVWTPLQCPEGDRSDGGMKQTQTVFSMQDLELDSVEGHVRTAGEIRASPGVNRDASQTQQARTDRSSRNGTGSSATSANPARSLDFLQSPKSSVCLEDFLSDSGLPTLPRLTSDSCQDGCDSVSVCLPGVDVTEDIVARALGRGNNSLPRESHSSPVRPRIRIPRWAKEAGQLEMQAEMLVADFSVVNSCCETLRMSASLSPNRARRAGVRLKRQNEVTLVAPGERFDMGLERIGRGEERYLTLTIRCATLRFDEDEDSCDEPSRRRRVRRSKYEFSVYVAALPVPNEDLLTPGFATDRPAIAFYGCMEECAEGRVKMVDEIRVFNGTCNTVPFSACLKSVVARDSARSNEELAHIAEPPFTIAHLPDIIPPRSWVAVTVRFNAPNDSTYYCGELQISIGRQKDHRIPLFGYGGSSRVTTHISDPNSPEATAVISNEGKRPALVDVTFSDAEQTRIHVGPGDVALVRIAPETLEDLVDSEDSNSSCEGGREFAMITSRDDILESRVNFMASDSEPEAWDNFLWGRAHPASVAFHYDCRALEFYGRSCTSLLLDNTGGIVHAAPSEVQSSARPPAAFSATFVPVGHGGATERVIVHNLDGRRPFEFVAEGCEPAKGRVPPFGDAELMVVAANVVVSGRGEGRDGTLTLEEMSHPE